MIAEWYLVLALNFGREVTPTAVPMQSRDACLSAALYYVNNQHFYASRTRCINTRTGEVVKP